MLKDCGDNRDRTGDLLVSKQTLSQLSYGPAPLVFKKRVIEDSSDIGGSGRSCTCDLTLIRGAL